MSYHPPYHKFTWIQGCTASEEIHLPLAVYPLHDGTSRVFYVRGYLKLNRDDTTAALEMTEANTKIVVTADGVTDNYFQVALSSTDMQALTGDTTYHLDFEVYDLSTPPVVYPVVFGQARIVGR